MSDTPSAPLRIIIKLYDRLGLSYPEHEDIDGFLSQSDIVPWQHWNILFPGITIHRLFSSITPTATRQLAAKAIATDPTYKHADLCSYYAITCPPSANADTLLQMMQECEHIEFAYLQSSVHPSTAHTKNILNGYSGQGYLEAAPVGINAHYAWKFAGGKGEGPVKFIDIEQGWGLHHRAIHAYTLPCTGSSMHASEEHGTAVLGIISMEDEENGKMGIAPRANGYVISLWRPDGFFNMDDAILSAVNELNAGDILLIQSQVFDPYDSAVAWPVEINEATWQVIRLATALGIVVIEPAGNGNLNDKTGNDLDTYSRHHKNILNPSSPNFKDSGAIMVAAASSEIPYTRIPSSNYGSRVNCFAWGENVFTAGSYPETSGFAVNLYTGKFNGTSAASAIIAGAAIAIQSIAVANQLPVFTPLQLRAILSNHLYGTSSRNGHFIDKTGIMPDLQKIIKTGLKDIKMMAEHSEKRNAKH